MTQKFPRSVTSVPCCGPNDPPNFPSVRMGRPLKAAVALLTLATAVSCSGHPDSAATSNPGTSAVPATDRSTPATVTTTRGPASAPGTTTGTTPGVLTADQQAVINAHDLGMAAYEQAASASNPGDPALKDLFAPTFLHEVQIRVQQRKDNGQAVRDAQPSRSRIEYVSVQIVPPTASLVTCEVDDRVVYRVADGSPVNSTVSTGRWGVAMTAEDGSWKIAGRHQLQTWDGEVMDQCLGAPQS